MPESITPLLSVVLSLSGVALVGVMKALSNPVGVVIPTIYFPDARFIKLYTPLPLVVVVCKAGPSGTLLPSASAYNLTPTPFTPGSPASCVPLLFKSFHTLLPSFIQLRTVTVAIDSSSAQGGNAAIRYLKVDVVAPAFGVNVPVAATNVPPVPVNLDHTPPGCSPVIKLNKSIGAKLSHTEVPPSAPAFALTVVQVNSC